MPEPTTQMVELLREIRDLLLPVADAYRDDYEGDRRSGRRSACRRSTLPSRPTRRRRHGGSPTAPTRRPKSEKQRGSTRATPAGSSSPSAS